ncbi:hypothetical protein RHMOL_Rhmol07G0251900 [Rhododendron molle]|uniref:Uncharacterized protein n=1 Tax=Rhododendron molle TaxID=49168 RepID=A0ACC0N4I5_RHOML|nr:hypothetical protein RHMOL_Rhmol07G0251900 [Rhododendron molle]
MCRETLADRDHCKETLIRETSPPSDPKEQNDQFWTCVQADLEADNRIEIQIELVQALHARIMYRNCGGNLHYWFRIRGRRSPTDESFLAMVSVS